MPRAARLIVGLQSTALGIFEGRARHDVGARLVDGVVAGRGAEWEPVPRLAAWVAALRGHIFAAPLVPYDASGEAVARCAAHFGIPSARVVVVHDEATLAPGRIRFSRGGSHWGNGGVRSVVQGLGTPDFRRVAVGVGAPEHMGQRALHTYLLDDVADEDDAKIQAAWADGTCLFLPWPQRHSRSDAPRKGPGAADSLDSARL